MEDSEIIELYWARFDTAIHETDKKYGGYCRQIAYHILDNREDAEECVNDAYFKLWDSIPPHWPKFLQAFLGKITRNLALNRYKEAHALKRGQGETAVVLSELEECLSTSQTIEQQTDEKMLVESLNRFLYQQPELKRKIFITRYWQMTPITGIAEQYHMSRSKVASILFRMRKSLKEHLKKEEIIC